MRGFRSHYGCGAAEDFHHSSLTSSNKEILCYPSMPSEMYHLLSNQPITKKNVSWCHFPNAFGIRNLSCKEPLQPSTEEGFRTSRNDISRPRFFILKCGSTYEFLSTRSSMNFISIALSSISDHLVSASSFNLE